MVVITRLLVNECRYKEIVKFGFKFVISDLENIGLCLNSIEDK